MTQVTPPGWYPDPGQTDDAAPTERWWDGGVWTDQTRAKGAAPDAGPGWGPPTYPPGMGPEPARPPRRGPRTAIGAAAALVVLACIGGGIYVLTADDDGGDGKDSAASTPSPDPSRPGEPGEGGGDGGGDGGGSPQDPGPQAEDGFATDTLSGISLPVPDGWKGQSGAVGAGVTTGNYPCPGDSGQKCVRGGAFSAPAQAMKLTQATAEAAAKADIKKNAEESYGGKIYGKITSHKQLASEAVTVAGEKGYQVRWKVVTSKGADGYVESLVFPSPVRKGMLVVVRFGIDDTAKAPKVSAMDEITKGIKKAAASSGNGQNA